MDRTPLESAMDYPNAARSNRLEAARWIISNPDYLRPLLELIMSRDDRIAQNASWALEFAYIEDPQILLPHLEYFFSRLSGVNKDSMVRALSNICEKLCVAFYQKQDLQLRQQWKQDQRESLVGASFDWLLADYRVACKVRAMTCLYHLGGEFSWVRPELKLILEDTLHKGSAGYKNRGLKILDLIHRKQG